MLDSVVARFRRWNAPRLAQRIDDLERSLARSDAIIDVLLFDSRFIPGGEAGMNGQAGRKAIVGALFQEMKFANVVETGTFFGMTSGYLWTTFGVPIQSCEAIKRHFEVSRRLLRDYPQVQLSLSDSRSFLRRLAAEPDTTSLMTFFYLDAHWYNDLPLAEEIEIICGAWKDFVVLVDDFCVPGDDGYGYDDYGVGKSLELGYMQPGLLQFGLDAYFPKLPSSEETGSRRGCAVIAPRHLRSRLDALPGIARHVESPA